MIFDVSILIASLKDCSEQIKSINNIKTKYSYEICVCTNEPGNILKEPNVKYFKDTGSSVSAFNYLFKQSIGKYIIILNGVVMPPKNLFSLIDELKEKESNGEKFIISSASDDYGASCFIPDWAQKECGLHFRPQILRWPCFSRDTILKYLDGVIFASKFKHHYVDNWLATFCGLNDQIISENRNVRITTVPHISFIKDDEYDREVYKNLCKGSKNKIKYDI